MTKTSISPTMIVKRYCSLSGPFPYGSFPKETIQSHPYLILFTQHKTPPSYSYAQRQEAYRSPKVWSPCLNKKIPLLLRILYCHIRLSTSLGLQIKSITDQYLDLYQDMCRHFKTVASADELTLIAHLTQTIKLTKMVSSSHNYNVYIETVDKELAGWIDQDFFLTINSSLQTYSKLGIWKNIKPQVESHSQYRKEKLRKAYLFFDCLERCQFDDALSHLDRIEKNNEKIICRRMLPLDHYRKLIARIRNPDQQLNEQLFQIYTGELENKYHHEVSSLLLYQPLRTLLQQQDFSLASSVLERQKNIGQTHWLDDFFSSIIAYFQGNERHAVQSFAQSWKTAEFYDALPRIEFELHQLPFITKVDICKLASSISSSPIFRPEAISTLSMEKCKEKHGLIGSSKEIVKTQNSITCYADTLLPVLITGETGVGKELVAKAIHSVSDRHDKPFVCLNCASVPDSLLESELFGHTHGSFSGASGARLGLFGSAKNGSIFLDEIGESSPRLQAALLRVLECREYRPVGSDKVQTTHARFIFATNRSLLDPESNKEFRQDLYHRISRQTLYISPLRNRVDDIPLLCTHFLSPYFDKDSLPNFSTDAIEFLQSHYWPGNVRELRNVIEMLSIHNPTTPLFSRKDIEPFIHFNTPILPDIKIPASSTISSTTQYNISSHSSSSQHGPNIHIGSTLRRIDCIKTLFRTYNKLTRKEIISLLNIAPQTATSYLKGLCNEGYIQKIEPSNSPRSHYFEIVSEKEQ